MLPCTFVGVDAPEIPEAFKAFGLEGVGQKHGVFGAVQGFDPVGSEEEGDIIGPILKEFRDAAIAENRSNKIPAFSFIISSRPITSAWLSGVIERNNNRCCVTGCKTNASNSLSACFNVDRKEFTLIDESRFESSDIVEGGFDPDFTGRPSNFGVEGFAFGFHQIGDYGGSVVPLPEDCGRMVCRE